MNSAPAAPGSSGASAASVAAGPSRALHRRCRRRAELARSAAGPPTHLLKRGEREKEREKRIGKGEGIDEE